MALKYRLNHRVFSFFLAVILGVGNPPLLSHASPAVETKTIPSDLNSIQIPEQFGKIKDSFLGKNGKTVVIIQDAHAIPGAQRSIQAIINYFQTKYGVELTAVEGASSDLDMHIFRSFPNKERLKEVFDFYLERGEFTGASAAAIFNEGKAVYRGIEDWTLYEDGLRFYLEAIKNLKEISAELESVEANLQKQKEAVYSPQLLEIDRAISDFYENNAEFARVLQKLSSVQSPEKGTELYALVETIGNERESFKDLEIEVKTAAEKIRPILEGKDLTVFSQKFQQFQTSGERPEGFALYLREISARYQLSLSFSKRLELVIDRHRQVRDIEGQGLFKDFDAYAREVKSSLFQNDAQRKLDEETSRLILLKRLARLELSHEQLSEFKKLNFDPALSALFAGHRKFYENAQAREDIFSRNLSAFLDKDRQKTALLVAGGFHSAGLVEKFKRDDVSFILITPHINEIPETVHYQDFMKGSVSWKEYFRVEKGKVDLYSAFVRAARDKLLSEEKQPQLTLKSWRDQIIRDLAAQGRITDLPKYVSFLDEVPQEASGKPEWFLKVKKFIDDLRELDAKGMMTAPNILNLSAPAALQAAGGNASTARLSLISPDLVAMTAAKQRLEARAELTLPSGEKISFTAAGDLRNFLLQRYSNIGIMTMNDDLLSVAPPGGFPEFLNIRTDQGISRLEEILKSGGQPSALTPPVQPVLPARSVIEPIAGLKLELKPDLEGAKNAIIAAIDWLLANQYPHPQVLLQYKETVRGAREMPALYESIAWCGKVFDGQSDVVLLSGRRLFKDLSEILKLNSPDYFIEYFLATVVREAWGWQYFVNMSQERMEIYQSGLKLYGKDLQAAFGSAGFNYPGENLTVFLNQNNQRILKLSTDALTTETYEGVNEVAFLNWARERGFYSEDNVNRLLAGLDSQRRSLFEFQRNHSRKLLNTGGDPRKIAEIEMINIFTSAQAYLNGRESSVGTMGAAFFLFWILDLYTANDRQRGVDDRRIFLNGLRQYPVQLPASVPVQDRQKIQNAVPEIIQLALTQLMPEISESIRKMSEPARSEVRTSASSEGRKKTENLKKQLGKKAPAPEDSAPDQAAQPEAEREFTEREDDDQISAENLSPVRSEVRTLKEQIALMIETLDDVIGYGGLEKKIGEDIKHEIGGISDKASLETYLMSRDRATPLQSRLRNLLLAYAKKTGMDDNIIIVFPETQDPLAWGFVEPDMINNLLGFNDLMETEPFPALHQFFIDENGREIRLILVRNSFEGIGAVFAMLHEFAHARQSRTALENYRAEISGRVLLEGYQMYAELELLREILQFDGEKDVRDEIREIINTAYESLPDQKLHNLLFPSGRGGDPIYERALYYRKNLMPAYRAETSIVKSILNSLGDKAGHEALQAIHRSGDYSKLQSALGADRYKMLEAWVGKFEEPLKNGKRADSVFNYVLKMLLTELADSFLIAPKKFNYLQGERVLESTDVIKGLFEDLLPLYRAFQSDEVKSLGLKAPKTFFVDWVKEKFSFEDRTEFNDFFIDFVRQYAEGKVSKAEMETAIRGKFGLSPRSERRSDINWVSAVILSAVVGLAVSWVLFKDKIIAKFFSPAPPIVEVAPQQPAQVAPVNPQRIDELVTQTARLWGQRTALQRKIEDIMKELKPILDGKIAGDPVGKKERELRGKLAPLQTEAQKIDPPLKAAIQEIINAGSASSVPAIIGLSNQEDLASRETAVHLLSLIKGQAAFERLLEMTRDEDRSLRRLIFQNFNGFAEDPRALDALIMELRRSLSDAKEFNAEGSDLYRQSLIFNLLQYREPAALEAFFWAWENEVSEDNREIGKVDFINKFAGIPSAENIRRTLVARLKVINPQLKPELNALIESFEEAMDLPQRDAELDVLRFASKKLPVNAKKISDRGGHYLVTERVTPLMTFTVLNWVVKSPQGIYTLVRLMEVEKGKGEFKAPIEDAAGEFVVFENPINQKIVIHRKDGAQMELSGDFNSATIENDTLIFKEGEKEVRKHLPTLVFRFKRSESRSLPQADSLRGRTAPLRSEARLQETARSVVASFRNGRVITAAEAEQIQSAGRSVIPLIEKEASLALQKDEVSASEGYAAILNISTPTIVGWEFSDDSAPSAELISAMTGAVRANRFISVRLMNMGKYKAKIQKLFNLNKQGSADPVKLNMANETGTDDLIIQHAESTSDSIQTPGLVIRPGFSNVSGQRQLDSLEYANGIDRISKEDSWKVFPAGLLLLADPLSLKTSQIIKEGSTPERLSITGPAAFGVLQTIADLLNSAESRRAIASAA